jgi:pimeloyl-ACP methyl ester carboxylesterase
MYRGIALDLSGHGESDRATAGYSVTALAADLAAVADGLRLRRFVLVGHSLGAMVAIEYAGTHRDRVSGLFLLDPSGDQSRLPATEIEEFLATMRQDPRAEIRWYFQQLLSGSNEKVAAQVLADLDSTPEDVLMATIESAAVYSPLPALEQYGGAVGCAVSELNSLPNSLPNLLPELPVQRLSGTGHWIMLDRPATLQTILQAFLADLRDRLRPATVH